MSQDKNTSAYIDTELNELDAICRAYLAVGLSDKTKKLYFSDLIWNRARSLRSVRGIESKYKSVGVE